MTKQPEDWLDDVPGDDIEDEDDEIIWVSKSEIKRDAEELKQLGAEMVELGKNALDKIPLDQDLRDAIELAQKIKKEGRRRQLQLIGKMLRQRDVDPIRQALDKLKNRHNQQVALFHKLEQIRDRLIDDGDDAVAERQHRGASDAGILERGFDVLHGGNYDLLQNGRDAQRQRHLCGVAQRHLLALPHPGRELLKCNGHGTSCVVGENYRLIHYYREPREKSQSKVNFAAGIDF